ncbi:YbhB/YbcL family Raf kinase inhibitor-like protein [Caldovatus sp. SYSU G05006]|uniref:YbhB/YbcL family Raf kinase inhibitor-like protein n=2 Tax=Caldovatus aquaticus TaxID=2865671 RepID=A0ABS7F1U4_9PROT|nr:YbhB/YbcL family Raf kinase inhibitor-like protein [Caldovatus aquaticus]
MTMTLSSPAFPPGGTIPKAYTCDGHNVSPPLAWSGVPPRAGALLLACEDPDVPRGVFRHWVAFDLPPSFDGLPEGAGAADSGHVFRQAVNDFGHVGYGGPCPPPGDPPHRYVFRLLALDRPLGAAVTARAPTCAEVLALARPHVIATTELVGRYGRSPRR